MPNDREPGTSARTLRLPELSRLYSWTTKSVSAVSDQGLFAASNFALNVLLARWLAPETYGAFSLAFAIFLLLSAAHTGGIVDPLLVFGSGRRAEKLHEYLITVIQGHWLVSTAIASACLLLAVILWRTSSAAVAESMLGLAIASPLILLQWVARRVCYVVRKPHYAAQAGVIYMLGVLVLTYVLFRSSLLSPFAALAAMGVASFISAVWLLRRLGVRGYFTLELGPQTRHVLRDHWDYGKWAASTHLLRSIPFQVYYILLGVWAGLEATGTMRANMNLILPMLHGTTALGILLVPALVRRRETRQFRSLVLLASATFGVLGVVYWAIVGVTYDVLIETLYGASQYGGPEALAWSLGLITVAVGPQPVFGAALYALERPDQTFRAYAASTVFALTAGVALIGAYGVLGAILALAAAHAVATLAKGWLLYRLRPRPVQKAS